MYAYRYVFGWESGRQFITPSVFSMGGFPAVPGPSRLANRWSLGGPTSDSDGSFRPAFEKVRRPRFTAVGVGLYSYPSVMIRRCPLVLPQGPLAKEPLARTI